MSRGLGDVYKRQVQPAPYAAGTGSAPLLNREAEFACMSYRERLALKHSDPDTYRRLREK